MYEFDKGCGFAIVTNDMAKEKIEEQLGKARKAKIDLTSRLTNKIQKKFENLEKKTNLQTRLTLNYIHQTPFHHVYMAQMKRTNQKKTFPCESLYLQ